MIREGERAPEFEAALQDGSRRKLGDWLERGPLVLYFYPKDYTPGCTKEACGFRDNLPDFGKIDAVVIGVSKDSVAKHDKFKAKYELPFTLASDEDGKICEKYGTWVEKNMYGRKVMGIERSTFLTKRLCSLRFVPDIGLLKFALNFGQALRLSVVVKDTPSTH